MPTRLTTEEYIQKAKIKHGNIYEYNLIKYINAHTKIKIICKKHGEFEQTPNSHLNGNGCPVCGRNNTILAKTFTKEIFIDKAKKVHGDKYDYSLVEYTHKDSQIEIICKIHGSFKQIANNHLRGKGCSKCNSSRGELKVENWLKENNKNYINQKKFSNCKNIHQLPFDFYLPEYNLCIEYDGELHFNLPCWNKNKEKMKLIFEKTKINDKIKDEYCKNNNIHLLRIPYWDFNNIETILNDYLRCLTP